MARYPVGLTVLELIVMAQKKIAFSLPPEPYAAVAAAALRQWRDLGGEGDVGDVALGVLVPDRD